MKPLTAILAMGVALVALMTPWAASSDTALILVNERYADAPRMRSVRPLLRLERDLGAAGFDVIVVRDGRSADMRAGLSRLLSADERERVVIVAAGHFLRSGSESWIMGTEARGADLAQVDGEGVSVARLTEVAALAPGRAVVALATEEAALRAGAGLSAGIGPIDPPQGVTVVAGPPVQIADFVSGPLLAPGTDIASVIGALPGLQAVGFLSPSIPFVPERRTAPPARSPDAVTDRELRFWDSVEALDTEAGYRAYLDSYPEGLFAPLARARLTGRAAPPAPPTAETLERALPLTGPDRRTVQRNLTILGFDTGGVDGVFGPATRRALAGWQRDRGYAVTGFLTREQLVALSREGEIREAVLAEERRAAQALDRAYWRETGEGSTPDGLRAYLDRYPDGLFADRARERLEQVAAEAWRRTEADGSLGAYRSFLEMYPDTRFADAARDRIAAFETGLTERDRDRAAAAEAALNLPSVTRLLVEQRLARLGLQPGQVDGTFDARTRGAIAEFQARRGDAPTGYLDQGLVTVLLAGSLQDILR